MAFEHETTWLADGRLALAGETALPAAMASSFPRMRLPVGLMRFVAP
jgi:hypothetical protein